MDQQLPLKLLTELNLAPPDLGKSYMGFSLATDIEAARQRFKEKYGIEPTYTGRYKCILWVGPVPKEVTK